MTSPLEKLRAIARNTSPGYEKREITQPKPPREGLLSFNSFISSPDSPAKSARIRGQDERFAAPSHDHHRVEQADMAETKPSIWDKRALSPNPDSPAEATSSPEQLLTITPNPSHPPYERNERNEISLCEPPPEGLLSFNSFLSSPETADSHVEPDAARWREAFAGLISIPAPAGFSDNRWRRIIDATGAFLDRWAETAIACGWTTLDVFGCDNAAPDRRFDCMGLVLLLDRCEVVGVDEHGADLVANPGGARQRFRRRPLPPGTVPLWQLQ
jgi:hypothetical protein